jgi:DNA-binding transcriptional regulator YiaG
VSERSFAKKCGNCRERDVELSRLDVYETEIVHDGRTYTVRVPDFIVPVCGNCQAVMLDDYATQQIDETFRRQAGLLTPEEIRSHRLALGLTQQALADAIRVSVSTLSRWETGGQIQQRSLDLLLRLYFELPAVRRAAAEDGGRQHPQVSQRS